MVVIAVAFLVVGALLAIIGVRQSSPNRDPFEADWTGFDLVIVGSGLGILGVLLLVGAAFVTGQPRQDVRLAEQDMAES